MNLTLFTYMLPYENNANKGRQNFFRLDCAMSHPDSPKRSPPPPYLFSPKKSFSSPKNFFTPPLFFLVPHPNYFCPPLFIFCLQKFFPNCSLPPKNFFPPLKIKKIYANPIKKTTGKNCPRFQFFGRPHFFFIPPKNLTPHSHKFCPLSPKKYSPSPFFHTAVDIFCFCSIFSTRSEFCHNPNSTTTQLDLT